MTETAIVYPELIPSDLTAETPLDIVQHVLGAVTEGKAHRWRKQQGWHADVSPQPTGDSHEQAEDALRNQF